MRDLAVRRRFYAEEIEAVANLASPHLIDALATVPRERFLAGGPWTVFAESSFGGSARTTVDDDPGRVYHNYAIAIDPGRQLFNGAPGVIAPAIDRLGLRPGHRVLHVGTGTGYYTALMAHVVGPGGRVAGVDVDAALASRAQENLSDLPWATVTAGNGRGPFHQSFDAVFVSAGVTHPEPEWLDAVATDGRLVVPLTATMPAMGPIGKGPLVLLRKQADGAFAAQVLTFVAIYSALGLRSDELNRRIGEALRRNPFPRIARLRRDEHAEEPSCWLHESGWCLAM